MAKKEATPEVVAQELPVEVEPAVEPQAEIAADPVAEVVSEPAVEVGRLVSARVLADFGELRCNTVVRGSESDIKALVDAGLADACQEAVSYAVESGAAVVEI